MAVCVGGFARCWQILNTPPKVCVDKLRSNLCRAKKFLGMAKPSTFRLRVFRPIYFLAVAFSVLLAITLSISAKVLRACRSVVVRSVIGRLPRLALMSLTALVKIVSKEKGAGAVVAFFLVRVVARVGVFATNSP